MAAKGENTEKRWGERGFVRIPARRSPDPREEPVVDRRGGMTWKSRGWPERVTQIWGHVKPILWDLLTWLPRLALGLVLLIAGGAIHYAGEALRRLSGDSSSGTGWEDEAGAKR